MITFQSTVLEDILDTFKCSREQAVEVLTFANGEMDEDSFKHGTWDMMYEHFLNNGEMPYGVAKARDGDPYEWIGDRIASMFG